MSYVCMCRAYCDYWGLDRGLCGVYGVCAEESAGVDYEEEELRRGVGLGGSDEECWVGWMDAAGRMG